MSRRESTRQRRTPGPRPRSLRPGLPTRSIFDIGEVADGYHLIARSISLSTQQLLFEFAFAPERAEGADAWLNMSYTADIPVSQDHIGGGKRRAVRAAAAEGPVRTVRLFPD